MYRQFETSKVKFKNVNVIVHWHAMETGWKIDGMTAYPMKMVKQGVYKSRKAFLINAINDVKMDAIIAAIQFAITHYNKRFNVRLSDLPRLETITGQAVKVAGV
jgi:hypothetical protein